jgi:predicted metal-dependent HD superfamily phosphohydrolase
MEKGLALSDPGGEESVAGSGSASRRRTEDTPLNRPRWTRLMAALGISEEPETFDALVTAYSEKHRHYHTGEHIDYCLRELDRAPGLANEPAEVELALWFHDAIYDPYSSDNEERSAAWACSVLTRHGSDAARVERVRAHILATRHAVPATTCDSQLVVDVDLSILGADETTYAAFERNVRKEYRWVPAILFRRKRAEILASFLARPKIYGTEMFHELYEQRARQNLTDAIGDLHG